MTDQMLDLWPHEIGHSTENTPLRILKDQASFLSKKTNDIIRSEVVTNAGYPEYRIKTMNDQSYDLMHVFRLVAPTLHYTYDLFIVYQNVTQYPLAIESSISSEACMNESDFIEALRCLLRDEKTLNIIRILIDMSVN